MSILEHDALVYRNGEGGVTLISLIVHGEPIPQGSKKFIRSRGIAVEDNPKLRSWRAEVASEMRTLLESPLLGALNVDLLFYFQRPKTHFGTGRNADQLKHSSPDYVAVRPDADKLARTILDAMTESALIRDDGQVAVLTVTKRYAPTPGVHIRIRPL